MDDLDPIRQLQNLLDDPGKLLEKITSIQSALGSVRAPDSTGAEESAVPTSPTDQIQPSLKAPNRRYSRALQTLNEIKAQLEERLLPLAERAVQGKIECLRERSRTDRAALAECVAKIDRCVLICVDRFDEYRRRYAELLDLNKRFAELGAAPEALPENLVASTLGATVRLRLRRIQQASKT